MRRIKNDANVFTCMVLMLAAGVATAQSMQPTEGTNLARGKVCTFDPPPSYPNCTDEGDPFDLTDGVYNGCSPASSGTVGLQPGYGWNIETMPIPIRTRSDAEADAEPVPVQVQVPMLV